MIDCASNEFCSDLALREDDRVSIQRTAAVRSLVWQIDWPIVGREIGSPVSQ